MGVRFPRSRRVDHPDHGLRTPLCQLLAAPFWGRLSDRYGRRPILMSSLAGACLSYLIFGFAGSIAWLLVSRMLGGFMAGNISAAFAYASDVSEPQKRAASLGLIGAAIGIGFTARSRNRRPVGRQRSAHRELPPARDRVGVSERACDRTRGIHAAGEQHRGAAALSTATIHGSVRCACCWNGLRCAWLRPPRC